MNKIIKRISYTTAGVLATIAMVGSATNAAHAKSSWSSTTVGTQPVLVADETSTPDPDEAPATVERSSWG